MDITYSREFLKQFHKLPKNIQEFYQKQESLFRNNWQDSRLHTKKLISYPYHFSFRITRGYRVLFVFIDHNTALFATIGHRKDVYR